MAFRSSMAVLGLSLVASVFASAPAGAQQPATACGTPPAGYNIIISDAPEIRGTSGSDYICAGPSSNAIWGLDGNDVIVGGDGDDTIEGGPGRDVVRAGAGDDVLLGGTGSDHLIGGAGNDIASGGIGDDVVDGGPGNDELLGDGYFIDPG